MRIARNNRGKYENWPNSIARAQLIRQLIARSHWTGHWKVDSTTNRAQIACISLQLFNQCVRIINCIAAIAIAQGQLGAIELNLRNDKQARINMSTSQNDHTRRQPVAEIDKQETRRRTFSLSLDQA